MLLSELIIADKIESAFGITVDIESFTPPVGLKSVVFNYVEAQDSIDIRLLDTVISYSLAGVDVTLDIPFKEDLDVDAIMSLALNLGVSISILPPKNITDESIISYSDILGRLAEHYFSSINLSKMIYPLTSYLEYMVVEHLGAADTFEVTDNYMLESFANKMPIEASDKMKSILKTKVYDVHGGQEAFGIYVNSVVKGVFLQVESGLNRMRENLESG
jgi:hypothetical protein